jgi:hypothetical protein
MYRMCGEALGKDLARSRAPAREKNGADVTAGVMISTASDPRPVVPSYPESGLRGRSSAHELWISPVSTATSEMRSRSTQSKNRVRAAG